MNDPTTSEETHDLTLTDDSTHDVGVLELNESVNEDDLMLTTTDNPHNPHIEYDMWKRWDNDNHYNTEEYIARLVAIETDGNIDDEFELNMATSKVIAEILANDDKEIYCLV